MVKNLPAVQETQVRSLGQEDLLEKGIATHSSTLAWRIPCTEEPGGLQSMESQKDVDMTECLSLHIPQLKEKAEPCIGEHFYTLHCFCSHRFTWNFLSIGEVWEYGFICILET